MAGLTLTGSRRYAETYRYNPDVLVSLLSDVVLTTNPGDNGRVDRPMTLAVTETERPMYEMIARYNDRLRIVTTVPEQQTVFTATRAYRQQHRDLTRPAHIITTHVHTTATGFISTSQILIRHTISSSLWWVHDG